MPKKLTGDYTSNGYFYRPGYGSSGADEYDAFNEAMEVADNQIQANKVGKADVSHTHPGEDIISAVDDANNANTVNNIYFKYEDGILQYSLDGENYIAINTEGFEIVEEIFKKANKVSEPTEDNFVSLTEDGDIQDSGKKASDFLENVVEDTTPELGGDLDCNNKSLLETQTVRFNGLYDNGNKSGSITIDWSYGQYQKMTVTGNITSLSFSNSFMGTLTLFINYSGAYSIAFNGDYTIKTEKGMGIEFTETNGAMDILKVVYYGVANTYVMGVMNDVK